MKKAYLVLSNGMIFEGEAIGAEGEAAGEVVFNTSVVGYLETLTDPCYAGQIIVQTFPAMGNYGVIEEDFVGKCALRGYVVREICDTPSNFRSQYTLDRFLKEHNVPGICGVDTREITRIIRENGVMNGIICTALPTDLSSIAGIETGGQVAALSIKEKEFFPAQGEKKYNVTLIDYSAKDALIGALTSRGCDVTAVPYNTPASEILAANPDGVVLSDGPGDPAENTDCIKEVAELIGKVPVLGISLGHQLAALALGGETEKLTYGHRGGNQPVKDVFGTRTFITGQNHGYAVLADSLKGIGDETFVNANDGTNEGMSYPDKDCVTVQFAPGGDTAFIYDNFISMMGGKDNA
ncbi:MAG: glutamine-hydrolyzing carbamoyl-phosphate synthase small subunit [Clostridia bacterium]|nr:glutamine-hydrolyzing carbamoyl-phosphate synthase small subunit [Clostridia bacterium]